VVKAEQGNSSITDVTFREKFDDNVVIYFQLKIYLSHFFLFLYRRRTTALWGKTFREISNNDWNM